MPHSLYYTSPPIRALPKWTKASSSISDRSRLRQMTFTSNDDQFDYVASSFAVFCQLRRNERTSQGAVPGTQDGASIVHFTSVGNRVHSRQQFYGGKGTGNLYNLPLPPVGCQQAKMSDPQLHFAVGPVRESQVGSCSNEGNQFFFIFFSFSRL